MILSYVYVLRKVGINTILELSCAKLVAQGGNPYFVQSHSRIAPAQSRKLDQVRKFVSFLSIVISKVESHSNFYVVFFD